MRQDPQRTGQKPQPMSAATVSSDARWMLEQLSLPVDPRDTIKARRERAIRKAGLSPAKGMRLWYRQTVGLMAHEYLTLVDAYKNTSGHRNACSPTNWNNSGRYVQLVRFGRSSLAWIWRHIVTLCRRLKTRWLIAQELRHADETDTAGADRP